MRKLFYYLTLSVMFVLLGESCSNDDDNNLGGGLGNIGTGACSGGPSTVTDIDGNIYNVITIGNQCWMKENLKTTRYRDGSAILGNLSDSTWNSTTTGAQADYNFEQSITADYGKLYNWYAVADSRGLCPVGWHVPGDTEWNELVKHLDPGAVTNCANCTQSSIAGGMLKATGTLEAGTGLWLAPNTGATNSSGFSGLPGGLRYGGNFFSINRSCSWWSSSQYSTQFSSSYAWIRVLESINGGIRRDWESQFSGFSVRCIRD